MLGFCYLLKIANSAAWWYHESMVVEVKDQQQEALHPVEKTPEQPGVVAAGSAVIPNISNEVVDAGVQETGEQVHATAAAEILPIQVVGEHTPTHNLKGTGTFGTPKNIFPGASVLSNGDGSAANAVAQARKGMLEFTGPNRRPFVQGAEGNGINILGIIKGWFGGGKKPIEPLKTAA